MADKFPSELNPVTALAETDVFPVDQNASAVLKATLAQLRNALGPTGYTTAQLQALSAAFSLAIGITTCTDCLTPSGVGSTVIWDPTTSKWRLPIGVEVTTSKLVFFANLLSLGIDLAPYAGSFLFTNLEREIKVHSVTVQMDPGGGGILNGGGFHHNGPNYASGPGRRTTALDGWAQYMTNTANGCAKIASQLSTKAAGWGALKCLIPYAYPHNASCPYACFVGWSNISNSGGALDSTMAGFLWDPLNVSALGASSTTSFYSLVRNGGTLVDRTAIAANYPAGNSGAGSSVYLGVELSGANTVNLYYDSGDAFGSVLRSITATGINSSGGLRPTVAIFKGSTTSSENYIYPAFLKALADY